jgi:hypothetical protein
MIGLAELEQKWTSKPNLISELLKASAFHKSFKLILKTI